MTDDQPEIPHSEKPTLNPAMDETIAPDDEMDTASDIEVSADGAPERLGRYHIKKLLGRGGMGSVYLAHDSQLDRDVALKVPKFDASANKKSITRFYREARSAANLSHPYICPVYDVGEIDGTHYIAMAFIKGHPLSDYVNQGKPPNPRVAAGIVRKVAVGMHEAHQSGIIHRDIKPANIMIDHRNEPVVMDFGLAVAQESGTESRLTQDGALIGSPAYMSPEQLQGDVDAIGPPSDVYALGVVLYELLAGRLPFDGSGSTIAMIGQILTKEPTELSAIRKDLDANIVAICKKAISKDVAERYGSMKEFAAALAGYLKQKTSSGDGPQAGQQTKTVTVAQIQINEKAKLAKTLCDSKQFAAAVPVLQQIIDNPEATGSKAFEYAKSLLPKVKQQIANEEAAKAPATAAPLAADDPFAALPDAATYRPPPRKNPKKTISLSKGMVAALGALGGVICIGLVLIIWQLGIPPADDTAIETGAQASTETQANQTPNTQSQVQAAVTPEVKAPEIAPEDPPPPRPTRDDRNDFRDRPGRGGRVEDLVAEWDKDNDGEIVLDDVSGAVRNLFQNADINKDGVLNATEIEEMKRNERQRRKGPFRGPDGQGPNGQQDDNRPQRGFGPGSGPGPGGPRGGGGGGGGGRANDRLPAGGERN